MNAHSTLKCCRIWRSFPSARELNIAIYNLNYGSKKLKGALDLFSIDGIMMIVIFKRNILVLMVNNKN